jgi:enoyl-CoA hydratase/carnithine racemase
MDAADDILVAVEANGLAVVTLNRPGKRNAVSLAMWRQLGRIFSDLAARADVRVVILTGAGSHFCAGADISEFPTVRADVEGGRTYEAANAAATLAIRDCAKPTIAAISGYGVGGGCGLALACDLRVGDATTRMGIPAARLGIIYGTLDCDLLYRQVGLANAKRVLFSGRHFGCDDCLAMGLVDVVAPHNANDGARQLAAEIAENAPLSLAGSKLVLASLATGSAAARAGDIAAHIDRALESADYREGARAFLEKRKPVFTGR